MSNKIFKILFGLLVISAIAMLTYYRGIDPTPFNSDLFFWALLFGSIAALIDGSLGMAYGVTGTAFLLGYGISPVKAVAYIHIAEIFVSGSSGLNHWKIGNVDTKLFKKLLIPGIVGAILGALVITKVKIPYLSIVISIYLFFMGIFLIAKAYSKIKLQFKQKNSAVIPLAVTGGFVDGAGGGLTVIANAPNPAGYSILNKKFSGGIVSPLYLFLSALGPTIVAIICYKII